MDSAPRSPQGSALRPDAHSRPEDGSGLQVVVERSGGLAGMVRRWTAPAPNDGSPAARAAHRIAASAQGSVSDVGGAAVEPESAPPSPVRDGFQWQVTCGEGSLRCDEAGRRRDPEVDELIRVVTES
ncbi:hypothetical protein [Citricoccus sp. GCM10030269]|uniref:hypothetical protein n=1 Tax=Citricoccus sp. GCM10030269 TaxID=3273388 RepID=UPI00361D40C1